MTDTPNVNPLTQEQPVPRRQAPQKKNELPPAGDNITIDSQKQTQIGKKGESIVVFEGNVDVRVGTYRLQADKVTDYEAVTRIVAEGNVVFDQADQQRITGSRAEWNYQTKTGFFIDSTGFTNQTQDGTRLYFTADRVDKISLDTIVVTNAQITACDENVPKWSFHAKRVKIKTGDRAWMSWPNLRLKGVPVVYLPYASLSLKHHDRASGFLTPSFGGSGQKGTRFTQAYYQTLGRSADITFRGDIYTKRGFGFGTDLRTRANSRSFLNAGFYIVKDRVLGNKIDAAHPDQGGSSVYVEGVHYFPNGFTAAADVNITSNLAFRQVFAESIQVVISPEERSQVFVNKDHNDYSFNLLARAQVVNLPNSSIRIRAMPSVTIDKRPSLLSFIKKLPVYFSFEGGAEGVSRKETAGDLVAFRQLAGRDPIISPSMVQRLDVNPRFEIPLSFGGWSLTGSAAGRMIFYSDSIDPVTQKVSNHNLSRGYGEFEVDLRPPALARDYHHRNGAYFFRHTIEPYLMYRRIVGLKDFNRIIRFDYMEAIADTSELEFGVTNRFFTRRLTENVNAAARKKGNENGKETPTGQPYEALTITVRGKYFFDPNFGGALVPGRRNQFYPINTLSGFTFGGVPRRFSPLNVDVSYRPRSPLEIHFRTDIDPRGGGMRAMAVGASVSRGLIAMSQAFYYTRAIQLDPSLAKYANAQGKEPGTLPGTQWSPSIFVGHVSKGLYGGASVFFDFQRRPGQIYVPFRYSSVTIGYTWDCCAVNVQNTTINLGLRKENRLLFSFRLNGIGTFGTESFGQRR